MPIYEYSCETCNKEFEMLTLASTDPSSDQPKCPECGSDKVKKLLSAGSIRSGNTPSLANAGLGCGGGSGFS